MKSLTEEQKRMRELMGFTYKDNSHDILAEQNIKVIREEHGGGFNKREEMKNKMLSYKENITYAKDNCISPKETAFKLQNKINVLLETMLVDVTKQIPIELGQDGVLIDGFSEPVPWDSPRKFKFTLPTTIKLSETLDVLFNDEEMGKCFKILYDNFPVISNQLNDDTWTLQFNGIRYKYFNEDKKYCKDKMVDPSNLNLNTLDNPFCVYAGKKVYKNVESAGFVTLKKIQLAGAELLPDTWTPETPPNDCECEDLTTGKMIKYPCDGPKPPECIEDITPIELKLDLVDAFAFDKVEDTDGTSFWHENGGKQFDDFIELYNETKDKYSMVWDQYLEFLKDKGVIIYGYASRDDDPNENMRGKYAECNVDKIVGGTKQARHKYNQCLSQKRADQVIKDIVALLPELDGVFTGKGMGESCKSGNCWKSGNAVNPDLTKEDRRVTGTFPKFKTSIKN
jgi:hypothetical protein